MPRPATAAAATATATTTTRSTLLSHLATRYVSPTFNIYGVVADITRVTDTQLCANILFVELQQLLTTSFPVVLTTMMMTLTVGLYSTRSHTSLSAFISTEILTKLNELVFPV